MVCTTVVPTQLPYNNCYDVKDIAEFIADYITYLPLDEPTTLPDLLPSPSTTLTLRAGDCMDMCNVLVSLLRGAGYNAYMVAGYAPKWITTADQSDIECPLLEKKEEIERRKREEEERKAAEERAKNKYIILTRPEHKSKYVAAREKEKLDELARQKREAEEAEREKQAKIVDPFHGDRVHCWVLILKGRRDVQEDMFIEASTGTIYPVSQSPYQRIDSIWNETNYWMNVQSVGIGEMSYDLSQSKDWEYVFIDERKIEKKSAGGIGGMMSGTTGDFESVNDTAEQKEREIIPEETYDDRDVLDCTISWCTPIRIDRDAYQARYPNQHKTIHYKNCTVEKYSPYHADMKGLVRKIMIYDTEVTSCCIEIRESFAHRKDNLDERITYPLENRIHSMYAPGKQSGLKDYIIIEHQSRTFTFYPNARVDGMIKREELIHTKVIEKYENRDDFLVYRSIAVDKLVQSGKVKNNKSFMIPLGRSGEQPIRKITEKYGRNPKIAAEADIRKRTHFLVDSTIRLDFHYGAQHVTASRHVIDKADKLEQAETEKPSEHSKGLLLRVDPTVS